MSLTASCNLAPYTITDEEAEHLSGKYRPDL
jgi:hypothetical protein